jgi:maltooligosyltrehalose trehalohydrolase
MWADDLHHSIHSVLTGERDGYYVDFGTYADLVTSWTQGYVYAGRHSAYRGHVVGTPLPRDVPGDRIVVALQNHDQIGNRAMGDRLSHSISTGRVRIGAAVVLLSAMTPLLFMGEEWGATTPWRFFAGHTDPDLQRAVREGRRREFAAFGWDPASVPDPEDPATRDASVLDWSELESERAAVSFDWYRTLLRLRRTEPDLADGRLDRTSATADETTRQIVLRRGDIVLAINLADAQQTVPVAGRILEVLASSEPGYAFGPGEVTLAPESCAVLRLLPEAVTG